MRHGVFRALIGGWIVACGTSAAAWAQTDFCAPFTSATAVAEVRAKLGGPSDEALVQAGVREFLRDPDPLLDDNRVGRITVGALARICAEVPLADGTPALEGTLDLAREYGRLGTLSTGWRAGLGGLSGRLGVSEPGLAPLALRLAATPQVTAAALNGLSADPTLCADLAKIWPDQSDNRLPMIATSLRALAGLYPETEPSESDVTLATRLCPFLPVAGQATDLVAALDRLGVIQAGNPAAFQVLADKDFAAWLQLDVDARLPRLMGTTPAVLRLLSDYQAGRPAPALRPAINVTLPACALPPVPSGPGYWSISPPQIAALQPAVDTSGLQEATQKLSAPSPAGLSAAIVSTLGVGAESCTAEVIGAVITAYKESSVRYSLDPDGLTNLKADAILSPFVPNLMQLQGVVETDRTAFDAAIRRAIGAAAAASEAAAAADIAKNVTDAAVEVQRGSDRLAAGFPKPDASPEPPVVNVPKEAVAQIVGTIDDKDVSAAVAAAMAEPAASREDLAARVAVALDPIIKARAQRTTDAAVAALQASGVIVTTYVLGTEMVTEIVAATQGTALSADQRSALESSAGLSYPFRHLMDRALAANPIELLANTRASVLAATWVPVAPGPRETGSIAADCGCSTKRADNAEVYGFYPFWVSDLKPVAAALGEQAKVDTPPVSETPPRVGKVDFEIFDRIAFEGLEIGADGVVLNKDRWMEARGDFIVSAHRHQVKADLAIRLRDWKSWQAGDVEVVARAIQGLIGDADYPPQPAEDGFSLTYQLNKFISRRLDGITLVVPDYGTEGEAVVALDKVVALIRKLNSEVNGNRNPYLHINLALHIDVQNASTNPAANPFQDPAFKEIMPGNQQPQSPIFYLLVYLDRPTTESKTQLREIVEIAFPGLQRIQVLRSIIPILPSEANRKTSRDDSDGEFVQFKDDILYFQDNFGGVGLWPATGVSRENGIGALVARWLAPSTIALAVEDDAKQGLILVRPSPILWQMNEKIRGVCRLTCPNRMAIYAVIAVTSAIGATLMLLSLHVGRAEALIRKYRILYGLFIIVMALLLLTEICDLPDNNWAIRTFTVLGLLMSGFAIYQWIYRKVDGPVP